MRRLPPAGLYAITDAALIAPERFSSSVAAAIHGGARMIQYRDKSADSALSQAQAAELAALCRREGVTFIVNDDVKLALAVAADGVHLGRDDADMAAARARLGEQAIIGVSCYNRLELALAAAEQGADYVAFGSFFPSPTKPQAVPASLELLAAARQQLHIPIAAIGGITPGNGAALIQAGANFLAVIHGVFGQPDIAASAREYARLFNT